MSMPPILISDTWFARPAAANDQRAEHAFRTRRGGFSIWRQQGEIRRAAPGPVHAVSTYRHPRADMTASARSTAPTGHPVRARPRCIWPASTAKGERDQGSAAPPRPPRSLPPEGTTRLMPSGSHHVARTRYAHLSLAAAGQRVGLRHFFFFSFFYFWKNHASTSATRHLQGGGAA